MPRVSRRDEKLKRHYTEKVERLIAEDRDEKRRHKDGKSERRSKSEVPKRKYKWSSEHDRVLIPGLPVALAGIELTPQQLELYLVQLKIEEISLKLRTGNLGIPVDLNERSPSPEPVYNTQGVRLNTREIRVRQKLEEERHELVNIMSDRNPEYRPPPDYKIPANKLTDKIFIPQERYPNINFIGLLIGPRGNTLKRLETDTNCKIIIRGKGSLKEGKMRLAPMPGEDEPLHALVTAPSEKALAKGISTIKRIIKDGIDCPDGNNELRQMQLRELAELNGTILGAEIARCRNCGATDHRHWECTETQNFTNLLSCSKCGGTGHLEIDCIYEGEKIETAEEKAKMDTEYQTLMKELGVNPSQADYPQMFGLPKGLVKDLPWVSGGQSYLNTNDPSSFAVGQNSQLALSNVPYNQETFEGDLPYIPGAAPMPTYTVRTLLFQDNSGAQNANQSYNPWAYPGYNYPGYPPPGSVYPPAYYPPSNQSVQQPAQPLQPFSQAATILPVPPTSQYPQTSAQDQPSVPAEQNQ